VIGFVDGAGNSNQTLHYQFIDKYPLPGITYYRLKQTDFDGSYEYSDWVAVEAEATWQNLEVLTATQPEGYNLRIFAPRQNTLDIQLIDMVGRVVFQTQIEPSAPGEINTFIPMPLTRQSIMIYRVSDGKEVVTGKMIR
jgi:hypothetical protein